MNRTETVFPSAAPDENYTYFAFISYKSQDAKWARWLKRQLQLYRLPARTAKQHRDLPRRCSPVFLDKTNLTPGVLEEGLKSEVQASKYLIVICSRHAHDKSFYLDNELRYFLEKGDFSRVIPFIVDESRDPVAECFPKGLAELCREKEIVGVSVHDGGRRTALLKVIAAMHGLKLEELESEDLRRRKRNFAAAALLAVLLLAAGLWCWDYSRVKTEYYLDYTTTYGLPVGIHRLDSKEVKTMQAHYALVSSRGKVRELRCENAAGTPVMQGLLSEVNHFSKAVYSYVNDTLSSAAYYDDKGRLILEMHYANRNTVDLMKSLDSGNGSVVSASPLASNTTGLSGFTEPDTRKSNVIRYLVTYDDGGYTKEIRYAANAYNKVAQDADGISGLRYERDDKGRVTGVSYLSYIGPSDLNAADPENFQMIGKKNGEAGMEFSYDENDDVSEIRFVGVNGEPVRNAAYGSLARFEHEGHNETKCSFYDSDGEPVLNDYGCAGYQCEYDGQGNMISLHYFGTDGRPVFHKDGYAGWESVYDESGRELRRSLFGIDGKPVFHRDGYAGYQCEYDAHGNMIKECFFDTDGCPTLVKNGTAGWEICYDEQGNRTKLDWLGTDYRPILNTDGYASSQSVFDERGSEIRRSYFGIDGRPILHREGNAGLECAYDERGNLIKVSYFGTDGRPILHRDGNAGYERAYDERGNLVKQSFFGTDGNLTLISDGYAGWNASFDERGNLILGEFFGADGKPVLMKDGYASYRSAYDDRNNEIRRTFYGTDGSPILIRDGVAGYEFEYDEYGNIIRGNFFGTDGSPILHRDGNAAYEREYDERGNLTRQSFFGTDGNLILINNGYAGWESVFDDRDNEIRCSFFGADGGPVLCRNGYAGWEAVYDERDNLIRCGFFDADGKPTLNKDGNAGYECTYDERGNLTRTCFFGLDGGLTLTVNGYAVCESSYDERGNVIRLSCFGTDGKPIMSVYGYASAEYRYDEQDNLVAAVYYDENNQVIP